MLSYLPDNASATLINIILAYIEDIGYMDNMPDNKDSSLDIDNTTSPIPQNGDNGGKAIVVSTHFSGVYINNYMINRCTYPGSTGREPDCDLVPGS